MFVPHRRHDLERSDRASAASGDLLVHGTADVGGGALLAAPVARRAADRWLVARLSAAGRRAQQAAPLRRGRCPTGWSDFARASPSGARQGCRSGSHGLPGPSLTAQRQSSSLQAACIPREGDFRVRHRLQRAQVVSYSACWQCWPRCSCLVDLPRSRRASPSAPPAAEVCRYQWWRHHVTIGIPTHLHPFRARP